MGKKKSKQHKDGSHKSKKQNGVHVDVRQVGAAVAGVLAGEIVNAAVQRLSQRKINVDDSNTANGDRSNPLRHLASQAGDRIEEIESSAGHAANTVRSSASDLTFSLSDVVDVLKDAGEQLKEKSADTLNSSSEAALENVSNTATAVLDRVMPDLTKGSKKSKKGKKKKKKS